MAQQQWLPDSQGQNLWSQHHYKIITNTSYMGEWKLDRVNQDRLLRYWVVQGLDPLPLGEVRWSKVKERQLIRSSRTSAERKEFRVVREGGQARTLA
jgi:hypothetical protein